MKLQHFFYLLLLLLSGQIMNAQSINGSVYADTNNLYIIKVQGTHYERGFAQGELLGSRITDVFVNYILPKFGNTAYYNQIKGIVAAGNLFSIDSLFIVEAKALIDGMNSVNTNPTNLDYADILLANSILDINSILQAKSGMQCSSLMSWNDATAADPILGGKSVISRHLDWDVWTVLIRNQVMVIHVPSEPNEQAWAGIGFAGMISVLSGFNTNIGVFQHVMMDDISHGVLSGNYEPIWFTLRKTIEQVDPNQDGANNVNDVKYFIDMQPQGYASGYIISALARSTEIHDSLIAMVAEVAAYEPCIIYRSNSFADSIPSDNLYTANSQIARQNSMNFCSRYNGIRNNIGGGLNMGLIENRNIMADYSHMIENYQFMTYAPEIDLFRISIRNNSPAYLQPFVDFSISNMLQENVSINSLSKYKNKIVVSPNPASEYINININIKWKDVQYKIYDASGRIVKKGVGNCEENNSMRVYISDLPSGAYSMIVTNNNDVYNAVFIVQNK